MSGGYDLCVIVEGKTMKDVALFVSQRLALLDSVISTATHFVLKKYKDHGIIFNGRAKMKGRQFGYDRYLINQELRVFNHQGSASFLIS